MNLASRIPFHFFRALVVLAPLALTAPATFAQTGGSAEQGPGQKGSERHMGPPPEALAACKSKKAADPCSFTSPHGSVSGSCWAPEDRPLACRPDQGQAGPGAHK
jgi:hypothetical protein